jgi:hypothetical protein
MRDFVWKITTIDYFTGVVVCCMVMTVFFIIRSMTESTFRALFWSPVLGFGALVANYLFRENAYMAVSDKDANIVAASAIGIIVALVLMLVAARIALAMSERKDKSNVPAAAGRNS